MSPTASGRRLRLLVMASTFPAREGDGTPSFVYDLSGYEATHFTTLALVPRVPGAARSERTGDLRIVRFPYFFKSRERLAHGAILENVRSNRWLLVQILPFFVGEAIALRRTIINFRPDVIHVHWIVPQGLTVLLFAPRIPWVVTTLGGDVYALRGRIWLMLKRAVLVRARAVTTMNEEMRDHLLALGAPVDRTIVLPMGVDLDAVRRNGVGMDRVAGRVLFAGRLVEKKGASVLLGAMRRLPATIHWSLDIVGDGPLRGELEDAAKNLSGRVRFLGQLTRQELSAAMHAATVVVVPSVTAASGDQDGLPVVLLEAMGAGCAIVASRIAGIDEAVDDGVTGILVPPGDADALTKAVGQLLSDDERRLSLGQAAAERSTRYSISAIGERFVELVDEAAHSRQIPQ